MGIVAMATTVLRYLTLVRGVTSIIWGGRAVVAHGQCRRIGLSS